MCITDVISLIGSFVVLLTAIVGLYGVRTWKRETQFKRRFELAEKVLANAYEAVEVIDFIRFPASRNDEGQSRKQNEEETPSQTNSLNNLYVIKERYINRNDSFKRLFKIRFQVKAVFEEKLYENLNAILKMPNKIFTVVDHYADTIMRPDSYTAEEKDEIQREYSKVVFARLTKKEEDPIYNEMKDALQNLEEECRKILK